MQLHKGFLDKRVFSLSAAFPELLQTIPKMMPDGSVFVSMGAPAKPSSASDGGRDERFNQKDFYDLDESIDVVKDDKLGAKAKDDASCGKDGANCENN